MISGLFKSAARSGALLTPNSRWKAARLSSERLKPCTISIEWEVRTARVSTLAQRPSPTIPTLTRLLVMSSSLQTETYHECDEPNIGAPSGLRRLFSGGDDILGALRTHVDRQEAHRLRAVVDAEV